MSFIPKHKSEKGIACDCLQPDCSYCDPNGDKMKRLTELVNPVSPDYSANPLYSISKSTIAFLWLGFKELWLA